MPDTAAAAVKPPNEIESQVPVKRMHQLKRRASYALGLSRAYVEAVPVSAQTSTSSLEATAGHLHTQSPSAPKRPGRFSRALGHLHLSRAARLQTKAYERAKNSSDSTDVSTEVLATSAAAATPKMGKRKKSFSFFGPIARPSPASAIQITKVFAEHVAVVPEIVFVPRIKRQPSSLGLCDPPHSGETDEPERTIQKKQSLRRVQGSMSLREVAAAQEEEMAVCTKLSKAKSQDWGQVRIQDNVQKRLRGTKSTAIIRRSPAPRADELRAYGKSEEEGPEGIASTPLIMHSTLFSAALLIITGPLFLA